MAKKTLVGSDIIRELERRFPKSLAMENDPIGLQIGDVNRKINKIMVALDVDQRVCDEAIEQGIDLIIAHHPIIYRPLTTILTQTPKGKVIEKLIKNDIAVYIMHTNLDIAPNGLNDWMAAAVRIQNPEVLSVTQTLATGESVGLGRIGMLAEPYPLPEFTFLLKDAFNTEGVVVIGPKPEKMIRKVAIMGGSGSGYWRIANRLKADVYLTGDITYHDAQEAIEAGICLIDIGHFSEHICKPNLQQLLNDYLETNNLNGSVIQAQNESDPYEVW